MKWPRTRTVCGSTETKEVPLNTKQAAAQDQTRHKLRRKIAQKIWCRQESVQSLSLSGLLATDLREFIDPHRGDPSVCQSACSARDNTARARMHAHTHTYMCTRETQSHWCSFSSSCQKVMHTCIPSMHNCPSSSQKFPAPVFSAWGCVFFFVCRNSCLHSPFPPNGGKENKNIMKGLKEITGCQSSETQRGYVCMWMCMWEE